MTFAAVLKLLALAACAWMLAKTQPFGRRR